MKLKSVLNVVNHLTSLATATRAGPGVHLPPPPEYPEPPIRRFPREGQPTPEQPKAKKPLREEKIREEAQEHAAIIDCARVHLAGREAEAAAVLIKISRGEKISPSEAEFLVPYLHCTNRGIACPSCAGAAEKIAERIPEHK